MNLWLKTNNKDWQIDNEFLHSFQSTPQEPPDLMKLGAYASLNSMGLRTSIPKEERKKAHEALLKKNPSIKSMMEGKLPIGSSFNFKLSNRELMNQIGEIKWDTHDINRGFKIVNFATGASAYQLEVDFLNVQNPAVRRYVEIVQQLKLPVVSGISGTLDHAISMAGLLGIGVSEDLKTRQEELELMRAAYIAFMVPSDDHSVHEVMQSAASYYLPYTAGPGYQKQIFPQEGEKFLDKLQAMQEAQGMKLPEYYLSCEFMEILIKEMQEKTTNRPS